MLLDAAGFDVVMVETVGVGQDEVEIARLADVTLVVMVPGMGDDVQAIKAGIMEIADVFVINKADLPGAEKLERELKSYLTLVASAGWVDAGDRARGGERRRRESRRRWRRRASIIRAESRKRARRGNLGHAAARNAARASAGSLSAARIRRGGTRSGGDSRRDPYSIIA